MEVILTSVFSAIIILITVFFMMKVFIIAYKRKEISLRKFIILSVSSIVIGVIVASVLPFGYQKI
jgi:FtsH-binding integral membrane protein